MALLTLELMQASAVLGAHPSRRIKLLVVFVLLVDMIGTAGACAHLYMVRRPLPFQPALKPADCV
jgi:hypothetical protein